MERPSARWFVVATFALLTAIAVPPPALAYSPWEWRYGETIYSTQAQALSAMHAQSDEHALLTKLLGVQSQAQTFDDAWIGYEYGAPDAAGVLVPDSPDGQEPSTDWWWDGGEYAHPRYYHSELDAATAYAEGQGYNSDPQCAPLSVQMSGPLTADWLTGGISRGEGFRTWTYTYERYAGPNQPCQVRHGNNLPPGMPLGAWRFRYVECPAPYTEDFDAPGPNYPCVLGLTDFIEKRAVTDDTCEATPHPVDVATGDKFLVEQDYDAVGLRFVRTYHAMELGHNVGLGAGWSHNYAARLLFDAGGRIKGVVLENGKISRLQFVGGGISRGLSNAGYQVSVLNSGSDLDAYYVLDKPDGSKLVFSAFGRLARVVSAGGQENAVEYDASDRVSTVTDPFGHQLTFIYDEVTGQLAAVNDPASQPIVFEYQEVSGQQRLYRVVHQDAATRVYHYEDSALPSNITGITDENDDRHLTVTYDSIGRALTSELAAGQEKVTVQYGATSTTVTEIGGGVATYSYDDLNGDPDAPRKCASISKTGAGTSTRTYPNDLETDVQRRPTQIVDANGNTRAFSYDGIRVASITDAVGTAAERTRTFAYGDSRHVHLPTTVTEGPRRTTITYDAKGNTLTKTVTDTNLTLSRTWTYTYNAFGKPLTANGPRTDVSDVTTYTYYSCATGYECGQLHTITNALGHVTTFNTYNAHGLPLTITDPNGLVTTLTYDVRERLTSRTLGSEQATFDYWPTGTLKKVTLPDASFLEYTYDAAHRLTEIEDAEGNRIAYTLDAMGNRTGENTYDPLSVLTRTRTRVFNTLNQLWKEIGAAGTTNVTTTFSYDNYGNQTNISAPLSRNAVQAYDGLNRLKQVTNPLSGVTQYGYDALDQLISATDPRSKVTSYTYDALGDLTQEVSPDTGTTTNTYDSGGNLATSTDARSKTGTYAYDSLNRVTSLTYPDQTISYTYDGGTNQKGWLTQVSDASGATSWSYDPHGRVLSRQQSMGVTKTLNYAYDSFGRLQTLTLPSGSTITYGYTDGKIASLTLNGSTTILSNVLYQPFGPTRGWTWGNSTVAVREYDTDGEITAIDSAGLKTYSHDDAFRISGITDATTPTLSQTFGYDLLDRMTSATGTSLNQGWTYDANGNRLTQTGSAASTYTISSTSNRLSSITGALTRTYGYDGSGNVTADGTATFLYNDAGRMISATKAGVTTTYAHNGLGQRVRKTTSGSSTYFVYDEAGHLVGEYDNSGSLIQETVWFGDTPVATLRPNGGGVGLYYIHTDHLNTPRRISRPGDNVVVWRWDSDPFGTTAPNQDPDGDSNTFVHNLRFQGQYFDSETGLHYNYFRQYDPVLGRFLQSDPIGLKGGMNTFLYALANALRWVDRFGLDCDVDAALNAERQRSEAAVKEMEARGKGDWDGVDDAIEDQKRYIREYLRACGQAGEDSIPKAPLPEPAPPDPGATLPLPDPGPPPEVKE